MTNYKIDIDLPINRSGLPLTQALIRSFGLASLKLGVGREELTYRDLLESSQDFLRHELPGPRLTSNSVFEFVESATRGTVPKRPDPSLFKPSTPLGVAFPAPNEPSFAAALRLAKHLSQKHLGRMTLEAVSLLTVEFFTRQKGMTDHRLESLLTAFDEAKFPIVRANDRTLDQLLDAPLVTVPQLEAFPVLKDPSVLVGLAKTRFNPSRGRKTVDELNIRDLMEMGGSAIDQHPVAIRSQLEVLRRAMQKPLALLATAPEPPLQYSADTLLDEALGASKGTIHRAVFAAGNAAEVFFHSKTLGSVQRLGLGYLSHHAHQMGVGGATLLDAEFKRINTPLPVEPDFTDVDVSRFPIDALVDMTRQQRGELHAALYNHHQRKGFWDEKTYKAKFPMPFSVDLGVVAGLSDEDLSAVFPRDRKQIRLAKDARAQAQRIIADPQVLADRWTLEMKPAPALAPDALNKQIALLVKAEDVDGIRQLIDDQRALTQNATPTTATGVVGTGDERKPAARTPSIDLGPFLPDF